MRLIEIPVIDRKVRLFEETEHTARFEDYMAFESSSTYKVLKAMRNTFLLPLFKAIAVSGESDPNDRKPSFLVVSRDGATSERNFVEFRRFLNSEHYNALPRTVQNTVLEMRTKFIPRAHLSSAERIQGFVDDNTVLVFLGE